MEFVFRITDYSDPALDAETAELLRQRLEARSREAMPGMWQVTDRLEAWATPAVKGRRRRYALQGAALIALGVFAVVPGLMEPRVPSLILTGSLSILAGLLTICGAKVKSPPEPPASCRREAAKLLKFPGETDWEALQAQVRFDETGRTVKTAEGESRTGYGQLRGVFESERLWLLVCGGERALLLQKKDLVSGEAGSFLPYLQGKIINSNLPYEGEST